MIWWSDLAPDWYFVPHPICWHSLQFQATPGQFNNTDYVNLHYMGRVKRIWYLSPMRAAKVQASLHIRAVSPEPPLLAHTGSESRGTFRQKARSLAPLNGWACTVKICHDGMLEDTNSLDAAHISLQREVLLLPGHEGQRSSSWSFLPYLCTWYKECVDQIWTCSSYYIVGIIGCQVHLIQARTQHPLVGQIISKLYSFLPETVYTPNFGLKSNFTSDSHPLCKIP